ncbi:MAG: NUDIX hydrolase [Burkholderiaceae bacterium]|nr:NUDIX hydrolase [Burkholderiaceae bacterium]
MPTHHPRRNEHGNVVLLTQPSQPTSMQSWSNPDAIATVIPDGVLPAELNGIALTDWTDVPVTAEAWQGVSGQHGFDEPAFNQPAGKRAAAGVVIQEADGRIWLISPSNRYGGYSTTFPKGRVDDGMHLQATAIREAYEESGLQVAITGFLADSERSLTYTRYYLARRVGGSPAAMGWESQAVHLVPRANLHQFLTHANDQALLAAIRALKPGEC